MQQVYLSIDMANMCQMFPDEERTVSQVPKKHSTTHKDLSPPYLLE